MKASEYGEQLSKLSCSPKKLCHENKEKDNRRCKIDTLGNFWILDDIACRILKYNREGELVKIIGREGEGPGEFKWPQSIDVDRKGNIYVCDLYNSRISIFDNRGNLSNSFITLGGHACSRVRVDSVYNIFIVGIKSGVPTIVEPCIHKYTFDGKYLKSFYQPDKKAKEVRLLVPIYMDIGSNNHIYLIETTSYKLCELSTDGKIIRKFGRKAPFYKPPYKRPTNMESEDWLTTWTGVSEIVVTNHNIFISFGTHKPHKYTIEVYNIDGKFVSGNIQTNYRLLCADSHNYLYFLLNEESEHDKVIGKFSFTR